CDTFRLAASTGAQRFQSAVHSLQPSDGTNPGAADIDFSHDFFQASGKGPVRIKHTLALAMGLESLDDTPAGDRAQYAEAGASRTRRCSRYPGSITQLTQR